MLFDPLAVLAAHALDPIIHDGQSCIISQAAQAEVARAIEAAERASPAEAAAQERDQAGRASMRSADADVSEAQAAVAEAEQALAAALLAQQSTAHVAAKVTG